MSQENLPIELKSNQLEVNKRKNKRRIEGIKRIGKIVLSTVIGFSGVAVSVATGPIIAIAGMGIGVAGFTNALMDTIYKKISKNSMFVQKKVSNGEIKIFQSVKDFKSFQKLKELNAYEKGAMMGLELLTELQSIKQQFEDKGTIKQQSRNSENNIYPQIYSTLTHGVNIDTIEALESLGYLQIERKEPKGKSNLFVAKLGFGQYQEAKNALFSKDESKKVQMYDIAIRVTDKAIDLEEIYKSYLRLKGTRIDIVKNDIGETVIDYDAQESFATRVKREDSNLSAAYRKKNYIGDTVEQGTVKPIQQDLQPNEIYQSGLEY